MQCDTLYLVHVPFLFTSGSRGDFQFSTTIQALSEFRYLAFPWTSILHLFPNASRGPICYSIGLDRQMFFFVTAVTIYPPTLTLRYCIYPANISAGWIWIAALDVLLPRYVDLLQKKNPAPFLGFFQAPQIPDKTALVLLQGFFRVIMTCSELGIFVTKLLQGWRPRTDAQFNRPGLLQRALARRRTQPLVNYYNSFICFHGGSFPAASSKSC